MQKSAKDEIPQPFPRITRIGTDLQWVLDVDSRIKSSPFRSFPFVWIRVISGPLNCSDLGFQPPSERIPCHLHRLRRDLVPRVGLDTQDEFVFSSKGFVGGARCRGARFRPGRGVRSSVSPLMESNGRGAIKGSIAGPSNSPSMPGATRR